MRILVIAILLAAAGCPGSLKQAATEDDRGNGSGAPGGLGECGSAQDCAPFGSKCCDCPTHAVPVSDPAYRACANVACPTPQCGSPMEAACQGGRCVLVCSPVPCDVSCPSGFATDGNGCLVCECAAPAGQCALDTDCARVNADCCGCELGGEDESVPTSQVTAHDAQLMCPPSPSCPGLDTCAPDLAPRCVQGTCALVEGVLPSNACGRPDLPACPVDACTLNANDQATMYGVGVCVP